LLPFALFCFPDHNKPSRSATANQPHPCHCKKRESTGTQGKTPVSLSLLSLSLHSETGLNSMHRNFWFCHIVALKFLILPSNGDLLAVPDFGTLLLSLKQIYGISTPPFNLPYFFLSPMVGLQ